MELPKFIQCPTCKTSNRIGKGLCKECMRKLPNKEEIELEMIKVFKERDKSMKKSIIKKDKAVKFNLMNQEE